MIQPRRDRTSLRKPGRYTEMKRSLPGFAAAGTARLKALAPDDVGERFAPVVKIGHLALVPHPPASLRPKGDGGPSRSQGLP
jgi:hypothetical protein